MTKTKLTTKKSSTIAANQPKASPPPRTIKEKPPTASLFRSGHVDSRGVRVQQQAELMKKKTSPKQAPAPTRSQGRGAR